MVVKNLDDGKKQNKANNSPRHRCAAIRKGNLLNYEFGEAFQNPPPLEKNFDHVEKITFSVSIQALTSPQNSENLKKFIW